MRGNTGPLDCPQLLGPVSQINSNVLYHRTAREEIGSLSARASRREPKPLRLLCSERGGGVGGLGTYIK